MAERIKDLELDLKFMTFQIQGRPQKDTNGNHKKFKKNAPGNKPVITIDLVNDSSKD